MQENEYTKRFTKKSIFSGFGKRHHERSVIKEQPTPQEIVRKRISAQVNQFVNTVDRFVAKDIGFEGNIIDEMRKAAESAPSSFEVKDHVAEPARSYVNFDFFSYRSAREETYPWFRYSVHTGMSDSLPAITIKNIVDGMKGELKLIGNTEADKGITNFEVEFSDPYVFHKKEINVETFFPRVIEETRIERAPLRITQRVMNEHDVESISLGYNLVSDQGDVVLQNNQEMTVGVLRGRYSAKERTVHFDEKDIARAKRFGIEAPQIVIDTATNTMIIRKHDRLPPIEFPLQANIHKVIDGLLTKFLTLPQQKALPE